MHTTSGADSVSGFMEDKDGNRIYKWKVLLDTVDLRTSTLESKLMCDLCDPSRSLTTSERWSKSMDRREEVVFEPALEISFLHLSRKPIMHSPRKSMVLERHKHLFLGATPAKGATETTEHYWKLLISKYVFFKIEYMNRMKLIETKTKDDRFKQKRFPFRHAPMLFTYMSKFLLYRCSMFGKSTKIRWK